VKYFQSLSRCHIALLSQVALLLKLVLVMPASNAVSERSFSALRRVKTCLRSSMGADRLNRLMLLHVHKHRTDALDLLQVANSFASTDYRRAIFGTFDVADLARTSVLKVNKSTQTSNTQVHVTVSTCMLYE
jgi:hypothetical protein